MDQKSNEITAIPELLKILELSGCLVTIDAMGCQVNIAQAILDADANYVLAVKGNQKSLHSSIWRYFEDHLSDNFARATADCHRTHERGHGRDETRLYFTCSVPETICDQQRWPQLTAIGMAINMTVHDSLAFLAPANRLCRPRYAPKWLRTAATCVKKICPTKSA